MLKLAAPLMQYTHSKLLPFLALAAAALLPAGWKDKAFPDWDDNSVLRLLTDSPWAKPKTVHFTWTKVERPFSAKDVPGAIHNPGPPVGSPVGGIGGAKPKLPDRADLVLRWSSALPLRHATALYRQRDEKLDPGNVTALIPAPQSGYVLEIFGVPAVVAHQGTGSVGSILRQSVYLRTRSGRTLRPDRVDVSVQGEYLSVLVHFSPPEPIQLRDEEIEITGDAQLFRFKERFKLSSMVYGGRLEL